MIDLSSKLSEETLNVFWQDLILLQLKLSTLNNRQLLDSFVYHFDLFDDCKNLASKLEKDRILELSKLFIDEFKFRIQRYLSANDHLACIELEQIMVDKLKGSKKEVTESFTPYSINNMLRLQIYIRKELKNKLGSYDGI